MTGTEAAQIARALLMRTDVGDLDAVALLAAAILDAYRRGIEHQRELDDMIYGMAVIRVVK